MLIIGRAITVKSSVSCSCLPNSHDSDCLVLLVMKPFYNHLCKIYPVILQLAKRC